MSTPASSTCITCEITLGQRVRKFARETATTYAPLIALVAVVAVLIFALSIKTNVMPYLSSQVLPRLDQLFGFVRIFCFIGVPVGLLFHPVPTVITALTVTMAGLVIHLVCR